MVLPRFSNNAQAPALTRSNRAIHREIVLYPGPEEFNPLRWLSPDYPTFREPLTKFPNLQAYSAFGFGRRICPGLNVAERSLKLLVARLGWACRVEKKPGVEVALVRLYNRVQRAAEAI